MQIKPNHRKYQWIIAAFLLLWTISAAAPLWAADPADLAKQIARKLSSVKRNISTNSSRAEKEWLQARDLITQLKTAAADHAKLAGLEKKHADLSKKLTKRLGRAPGAAAVEAETTAASTVSPPPSSKPAASDLPSSVVSGLKKINTNLDAVGVALDKNQLETAKRRLATAQKAMDKIQKRYASKIPAGNEEMAAATTRLETVGAAYARARADADARAAAEAAVKDAREAQSQEWYDKLNPFVYPGDDRWLRIGANFNYGSEEEKKVYRAAYDQANKLMAEYQKVEFPHGKTNELDTIAYRFTELLFDYNEGEKRARQAEACQEWVDTLRGYLHSGAGTRKYLIASTTLDETEINNRAALLEEAQGAWAEYQKAEFPLGKTERLLDLEKEMAQRLEEMPETLRQSRALVSGQIEKEYDRVLAHLKSDTGWQQDITKTPNIAMERDIKPLRAALARYAETVEEDDTQLATLRAKMTEIEETDQANRLVRAQRTYMLPEKYRGSDRPDLEEAVTTILEEAHPKAKPLRVTLPAQAWKEERVVEWTDTTQTALRARTTRFMTTQITGQEKGAKAYLYTVHLASDRTSDGSWGPLYGHIMFTDWIAEENVNKKPPTP